MLSAYQTVPIKGGLRMSTEANKRAVPPRCQLAIAISAALAGSHNPAVYAAGALEEIVVTARKREENLQDIPQDILAIQTQQIVRAGLQGLDDYARFIPSLSYVAQAPGANKLIFRGVADTNRSFFSDASAAIYLDEQPLTQPTQTPEPRLVDIARIEALSGPQGSLYGGSAQSGTLRIVTNKPDPTRFEAIADVALSDGRDSDPSYDVSGVVNIPLVEDKVAIRLVGFSASDGGFIDNVLGMSPGGGFDNSNVVEDNEGGGADYAGGRASLRWFVNENWAVTAGAIFQDLESRGNNDHEPALAGGDLRKVRFLEEEREDTWSQVGITLDGDLGFAQIVSATTYFTREIFYALDNTAYVNYLRDFYTNYGAYYVQYAFGPDPVGLGWLNPQDTRRISQEIRLSHEGDKWAWIAGLFYEHVHDHWDFQSRIQDYEATNSFAFWQAYYGAQPGTTDNAFWNSNNKTKSDHFATFGEVTHHLNDHWSFTAGGRWFRHKRDRAYFVAQPRGRIAQNENPVETTTDFTTKASIQYRFDEDRMIYLLYSEGFRPGGGNIARPGVVLPLTFDPDILKNTELGLKSRWFDSRLQANVTAFHMAWDDFQTEVLDPGPLFATMVINAGDAEIDGIEIGLSAVPIDGLELNLNAIVLDTELKDTIVLPPDANGDQTIIAMGGARLPITPEFKVSASVQYTWDRALLGGNPYFRIQYSYQDDALSEIEGNADSEVLNAYSITDARVGLEADTWELSLFGNNLSDERAELFKFAVPPDAITVNRPREFGVHFMKRWGD